MAIKRRCDSCGEQYTAERKTSKYCGPTCRVRASRGATVRPIDSAPSRKTKRSVATPQQIGDASSITETMKDELREADRLNTVLGQAALNLSLRIDSGRDTGSAIASLTKEMRATYELAMRGITTGASPLDELLKKRLERLRTSG